MGVIKENRKRKMENPFMYHSRCPQPSPTSSVDAKAQPRISSLVHGSIYSGTGSQPQEELNRFLPGTLNGYGSDGT